MTCCVVSTGVVWDDEDEIGENEIMSDRITLSYSGLRAFQNCPGRTSTAISIASSP